jgi:hypothetical protein
MSWKGDDSSLLVGIKAVYAGLNIWRFLPVRIRHLSLIITARSFGGLRMTVKVEGCHPKALSFCIHPADNSLNGLLYPMLTNDS